MAAHLYLGRYVQRCQRLVEQDQVGLQHERPRHRHALLLTTRERTRPGGADPVQAETFQRRFRTLSRRRPANAARPQPEGDVVHRRHVGKEQVVLEHQPDLSAFGRTPEYGEPALRAACPSSAILPPASGCNPDSARSGGGLPRSVRADQGRGLSPRSTPQRRIKGEPARG